ncbi:FUSC family protein [Novosphingobium lubricantis]|jgi:hypothetical protein
MSSHLDTVTPGQIAKAARPIAIATGVALCLGYVSGFLNPLLAGIGAFTAAAAMLLAAPRQRATEMLGAATIWTCFAEFLATIDSGDFHIVRLAVSVATLGGVMAIIRIQHLRDLARRSPEVPLCELDRRAITALTMVPPSAAQLAELRQREPSTH